MRKLKIQEHEFYIIKNWEDLEKALLSNTKKHKNLVFLVVQSENNKIDWIIAVAVDFDNSTAFQTLCHNLGVLVAKKFKLINSKEKLIKTSIDI